MVRNTAFACLLTLLAVAAPSFAGTTIYNIDQKSGWSSCTGGCAGSAWAPYSMTEYRSSPSMDGASAEFWIGGSTPYSNALWWKQLGGNSSAYNFTYDLYFYLKNSSAPQSLEFDVNQSVGGHKFIFGTQCDIRDSHTWMVWDTAGYKWVSTGIWCSPPTAYKWNHLTWHFQRSNGQARFVSFTLNGVTHYVNRYYWPQGSSVSEINVAFQMDGNYAQTNYSTWLDKVTLTYW